MDFPLTAEQKVDLKKQQKQTKDKTKPIKIRVWLFLDLGFKLEAISEGLGIDIVTVLNTPSKISLGRSEQ